VLMGYLSHHKVMRHISCAVVHAESAKGLFTQDLQGLEVI